MGTVGRRDFLEICAVAFSATLLGTVLRLNRKAAVAAAGDRRTAVLRPPAALPEKEFLERCIGCKQCAEVCPNGCIKFGGPSNTPYLKAREQPCILCMKCTQVCPSGALQAVASDSSEDIQKSVRMGTAEVDKNICNSYNGYACGACVQACPFEGTALKALTWERPVVDPEYCVGCGLCEKACIVYPQAIRVIPATVQS